jgi:hypothetical protein
VQLRVRPRRRQLRGGRASASTGGGPTRRLAPHRHDHGAPCPAGFYDEFELEVEDLEDDENYPGYAEAIAALRTQIATSFSDWPEEASVRVEGSFTPTGGVARPFVAYIDAEVEVELDLSPPLEVGEGAEATLDVVLSPERWFVRENGSLVDLSAFDYQATGEVLELEVEIEDGFEVEIDDD